MRETVAKQRPMIDLEQFERRLRQTTQSGRAENDPLAELARLSGEREDPYKAVFERTPPRRAGAYDDAPGRVHPDRLHPDRLHDDWGRSEPEPEPDFDYRALRAPRFDERASGRAAPLGRRRPAAPEDDNFDDGFTPRPTRGPHDFGGQAPASQNFGQGFPGQGFERQRFERQDFGDFDEPAPTPRHAPRPDDARSAAHAPYARGAQPPHPAEPEDDYPEYPPIFDQDDWRYQDDQRYGAPPEADSPREPRSRRPLYIMAAVVLAGVLGVGATFALRGSGPTQIAMIRPHDGPVKIQPENSGAGDSQKDDPSILDRTPQAQPVAVADGAEQPVDLSQMPERAPRVIGMNGSNASPARTPAHAPEASGEQMSIASLIEPKKVKTISVRPDGSVVSGAPAEAAKPAARTAAPKVAEARPAAPQAESAGGWAAQLAAPSSEAEAREIQARLVKKYGGLVSGFRPTIHKATSGDKTVYRVRSVGLTKAEATALCQKVQGAGGACFVARN
ncbi:SPOR domain-containing protein [Methylocella sp.]|uniref:SPOR domain-containing protein n=1 Tax=Methylocella sp. TaxID=1978226 RepID=UPI0037833C4A